MICKIYEDRFGIVRWSCLNADIDIAQIDPKYLSSKTTGSLMINIEDLTNSLIWDNESKQWLSFDVSQLIGGGSGTGGGGGDAKLTKAITANVTAGAINAGTTLGIGLNLTGFVEKLLCKDTAPSITINLTCSDSKAYTEVREAGVAINVTASITITKKSYDVATGQVTSPRTINEAVTATGGTFNETFSDVKTTTKFSAKATDVKNLSSIAEKTITFVSPMYLMILPSTATIDNVTQDDIKAGTKALRTKGNYQPSVTADGEKVAFAYPKSYGELTKIVDVANNIGLKTGYDLTTVSVDTLNGAVDYYCYVPKVTSRVTNAEILFSWA